MIRKRRRKTIPVDDLKWAVNRTLRGANGPTTQRGRVALIRLLEPILIETGNWRGYGFIDGTAEDGFGDRTRRRYY